MKRDTRFIIRRQVLDVASKKGKTNTPQLQEQIKAIYNQYFLPIIERCCIAIDKPNKHIRLDKIVIDIAALDVLNPNPQGLEKALQAFEQNLMQTFHAAAQEHEGGSAEWKRDADAYSPNRMPSESQKQHQNSPQTPPLPYPNTPNLDLLQYFLSTGQLPWWADTEDRQAIDTAVLDLIERNKQAELTLFLSILKQELYRERFIRNISDETLMLFYKVLEKSDLTETYALSFQNYTAQYKTQTQRLTFWDEILSQLLIEGKGVFAKNSRFENNKWVHDETTPPQYFTQKEDETTEQTASKGINQNTDTPKREHTTKPPTRSKPPPFQQDSDHPLYIQNAGLILLAPYLPQFFENLQWVAEKKFVNDEKATLAVQMLQFLADGQPEAPEFLLALPKILCGLDPDALHTPEQALTEIEQAEAENFLEAILENAPELGLKTSNALRGSFLLRQGVLRPIDNHWTLHIEVETYDLVLHKIPWNFQIIKLPWMPMPIFVDWALPNF
jgi:hypothetical protein